MSCLLGPRTAALNRCSSTPQNCLPTSYSNKCSGYILGLWEIAQCFPEECHLHKSQRSYCWKFSVFLDTMELKLSWGFKVSRFLSSSLSLSLSLSLSHSLTDTHTHTHPAHKLWVDSNLRGLKNTPSNMQICLQPDCGGENSRLTAGNSHFSKVAKCLRWFKKPWTKPPQCHQKVPEAKEKCSWLSL